MAAGDTSQLSPSMEIDCYPHKQYKVPSTSISVTHLRQTTSAKQDATTFIGEFKIPLTTSEQTNYGAPPLSTKKPTFAETLKMNIAATSAEATPKVIDSKLVQFIKGSLQLKTASLFRGKPSVTFNYSEKHSLIARMGHVLIAKFSHGRPPLVEIKRFLNQLHLQGNYTVSIFDLKHVMIECVSFVDFTKIWIKRSWNMFGFPVRIFKWTEDFCSNKESTICPVWIHLPELPLYFYEEEALLSIANTIGKPLFVDKNNLNRTKIDYASICIEYDVSKPPVDEIWIAVESVSSKDRRDGFWQKVSYTDIPAFCVECHHLGHSSDFCKRKMGRMDRKIADLLVGRTKPEDINALNLLSKEMHILGEAEINRLSINKGADGNERGKWLALEAKSTDNNEHLDHLLYDCADEIIAAQKEGQDGVQVARQSVAVIASKTAGLVGASDGLITAEESSRAAAGHVAESAGELDGNLEHTVGNEIQEGVRKKCFTNLEEEVLVEDITFEEGDSHPTNVLVLACPAHVKADCYEGVQQLPPVLEQKIQEGKQLPSSAGTGLLRLDLDMQDRIEQGQNFALATAADLTREAMGVTQHDLAMDAAGELTATKIDFPETAGPVELKECAVETPSTTAETVKTDVAMFEGHVGASQGYAGAVAAKNLQVRYIPLPNSQIDEAVSWPTVVDDEEFKEKGCSPSFLSQDTEDINTAFSRLLERMRRLKGEEPYKTDVNLTGVDAYAKKETETTLSTPPKMVKRFDTRLPIDFDQDYSDNDGGTVTWSQLMSRSLKVLASRSLSPTGRSSKKLSKLRKRVEYINYDEDKAIVMEKDNYNELDEFHNANLRQRVSSFKEQRKASSIARASQVDEHDWTPAQGRGRRGRNRNRKK